MKKKLALFMVLAMIVSLIPMNVFAATDNYVSAVKVVKKDAQSSVTLTFVEKANSDFTTASPFKLSITNGEFVDSMSGTGINATIVTTSHTALLKVGNVTTGSDTITVSFNYKVTSEADVTVDVDGMESGISTQNGVVIARGASGGSNVTISSVETLSPGSSKKLGDITVAETAKGSLTTGSIGELKLPTNYTWNSTVPVISVYGDITSASVARDSSDLRKLKVTIVSVDGSGRGGIILSKVYADVSTDAKTGDVEMTVGNNTNADFSSQTIKVATFSDYGVTVSLDKDTVPTLYAGILSSDSDDVKIQTIKIKEDVSGSLLSGRTIKVDMGSNVKIVAYQLDNDTVKVANTNKTNVQSDNKSSFEFSVTTGSTGTDTGWVKVKLWVSINATYAGDVTAHLSGKALPKDYDIVVAKAAAPAAITVKPVDVKLGLQKQPMGEIVLTEPKAGLWKKGKTIQVVMPDAGLTVDTDATYTVTKGNLEIETTKTGTNGTKDTLQFNIKSESTSTPGEVTIKGATVKLVRTLAEGEYKVKVKGGAGNVADSIVQNGDADANSKFDEDSCASAVAFRVITPADQNTKTAQAVTFTIGAKEYKVGDTTVTADVAPMIDANGRTLLPLRAFANALNVSNDNIVWNEAERSVIVFKGDTTVKVVIGQNAFTKNGVVIPMDSAAVIKDGRTLMPLRAVAQAMGAQIAWDDATKTVTVQ